MISIMKCLICLEVSPKSAVQKLLCDHQFCAQCLSLCAPGLCPYSLCCAARNMQVFVDELEGLDDGTSALTFIDKHNRIVFGDRGPNLLKLEERQRCEAARGATRCCNTARITISECRHRACFDCLEQRIHLAACHEEIIYCPRSRCANQLNRIELAKVAEKKTTTQNSCKKLIAKMEPLNPLKNVKRNAKDDYVVSCSIYHVEGSTWTLSIPKISTVGDMINAFTQIYGLGKSGVSTLRAFIRKLDDSGKAKYELINSRASWKKTVHDVKIIDKTNIIIDLHGEIDSSK